MLVLTKKGFYCPRGDFYIDPKGAVDRAVITHAHSDHARRGSKQYFCVASGVGLLKSRIGKNISVSSFQFGESFELGGVKISFHPAGHILGSSQVRMESNGEVWVASGDYKRDPDPTCEPFEVVPCDVFVTEATFGTPAYRWKKGADIGREIFDWWEKNAKQGINSILFAYSLGKAQRVLGVLEPYMTEPICCHPSMKELTECYRNQGVTLAMTACLDEQTKPLAGALILGPQNTMEKYSSIIGEYRTAFASGWMARSHHGYDKGFLMSDHADWDDLVRTIQETNAKDVYVEHRGAGALVRHLKTLGINAHPVSKLENKLGQLSLF